MQKLTLENDMPVLVVEQPDSKVVTLDVWINTGSASEPKDINGVSHFLEHMLFKGTESRGVGEIDRQIESVGGIWNAGTSIEFTHYYLTLAKPFVELGIDNLSDVITSATIDSIEVEKERQVILEEYYRQQDNPPHFLMAEAIQKSFEKSPNRWPVLGTPETINAVTRDKLYEYYTTRYAPKNMVLVIVGGIKAKSILPQLEKSFGKLNRSLTGNLQETLTEYGETIRRKGFYKEYPREVRESYLVMTLPAPDLSSPRNIYAFDLVSYILGEGRSSRLYQNVKEEKNLASSITASFATHRRDALMVIFATFDYARKDQLIQAVSNELADLQGKKVSGAELDKAKRMLTNQFIFSQETTSGRASEVAFYYTLTGDITFEKTYLSKIQEVSPADIQRVCRLYLDPTSANIFIVRPEK